MNNLQRAFNYKSFIDQIGEQMNQWAERNSSGGKVYRRVICATTQRGTKRNVAFLSVDSAVPGNRGGTSAFIAYSVAVVGDPTDDQLVETALLRFPKGNAIVVVPATFQVWHLDEKDNPVATPLKDGYTFNTSPPLHLSFDFFRGFPASPVDHRVSIKQIMAQLRQFDAQSREGNVRHKIFLSRFCTHDIDHSLYSTGPNMVLYYYPVTEGDEPGAMIFFDFKNRIVDPRMVNELLKQECPLVPSAVDNELLHCDYQAAYVYAKGRCVYYESANGKSIKKSAINLGLRMRAFGKQQLILTTTGERIKKISQKVGDTTAKAVDGVRRLIMR